MNLRKTSNYIKPSNLNFYTQVLADKKYEIQIICSLL